MMLRLQLCSYLPDKWHKKRRRPTKDHRANRSTRLFKMMSPVVLCNLMKVVVIKVLDLQLRRALWTSFFLFLDSKIQHPKATVICNLESLSMHIIISSSINSSSCS